MNDDRNPEAVDLKRRVLQARQDILAIFRELADRCRLAEEELDQARILVQTLQAQVKRLEMDAARHLPWLPGPIQGTKP